MKGGWPVWWLTVLGALWAFLGPLVSAPVCRCAELWLRRDAGRDVPPCPAHGPL